MEHAPGNYAVRERGHGRRSRMPAFAGYLLLAAGIQLLAGCATTGGIKAPAPEPEPVVAAKPAPSALKGPAVEHFTDGREGFVIRESSGMDAKSREEFDQAGAMIKAGDFGKAVELLEKVIAQCPQMSAPHINMAIAYERMNKPEQAEQHLKKALELFPGHPVASNEYGLLLRKAGRFAESRKIYEKSLESFPEYSPIHKNLAILCDLYLNDPACALEHYQIYGKAMPKDKHVKIWIADLQARMGH